jgi:hypothetical protein
MTITFIIFSLISAGLLSNQLEFQYINNTSENLTKSLDLNDPSNPENIIIHYCIQHADRVARGQDVIQDLIISGLVSTSFNGKTCPQVLAEHELAKAVQELRDKETLKQLLGLP